MKFLDCAAFFIASLLFASRPALAINESLYFRLNSVGEVEAVVIGENSSCGARVFAPTGITITANSVVIDSPVPAILPVVPCVPLSPYEVVANLGVLSGPTYSVIWKQGAGVLFNTVLTPASLAPQSIPAMSPLALWLMALLIILLGIGALHRTARSP
jgi:hypothetical protein